MQSGDSIEWERASGIRKIAYVRGAAINNAGYRLMCLALEKMFGVEMISAEFNGTMLVFETAAQLIVDAGKSARFTGAYELAYELDDCAEHLPTVCLRSAVYERDADYEGFASAMDKKDYVLHGQVISSKIAFCDRRNLPRYIELINRSAAIMRSGIAFEEVTRTHIAVGGAKIGLNLAGMSVEIFHVPVTSANRELDEWMSQWQAFFNQIDSYDRIEPDDAKIRMSYRASVFDMIATVG